MGHRTVIGFMWVETTVSEIWDIPPVFSTYENSRLIALSRLSTSQSSVTQIEAKKNPLKIHGVGRKAG